MKRSAVHFYDLIHAISADLAIPADADRVWDEIHAVTTLQGIVNRHGP